MSNQTNLDEIRRVTLDHFDRANRNFVFALAAAAVWEAFFMVAFFLVMERNNRLHLLLLIATVGSYTVVVFGLIVLGAYFNRNNLRILKAIELMKNELIQERK
jgi:hypothetical protein